jgi:signal transduction histidine kinase
MQNLSVLIVDDETRNLQVAQAMLSGMGYKVLASKSGNDALEITRRAQPTLILLDINMPPGMNGFETCTRLKSDEATRHIPVIFMTARSDAESIALAFELGAVDYITKPVCLQELQSRVDIRIQLHLLQTHLEQMVAEKTAALDVAYRKLELLDKTKSDFIAIASHELRTPIAILSGYAQMLAADEVLDERLSGIAQGIQTGVSRVHQIVDAMIEMGRIDEGVLVLHRETVHLRTLAETIVAQFAPALAERNISLSMHLDTLPPIEGDSEHLKRAFANLVGNAIKYTPNGGRIEIDGSKHDDAVEIAIRDTGIGIDPQYHELIFEKFYQTGQVALHSSGKTKFKGGGPGLGLPIARGIIQAHGGRIWVESNGHDDEKCPGSVFHVVLPIRSL